MDNSGEYRHVSQLDLRKHNVSKLYHFTKADNLENIMRYGLLPKTVLNERSIGFKDNDTYRLDKHADSISLSISFPNYLMFYRYRKQPENKNVRWAILELDAWRVLCNPSIECAYYWYNAADSRMSQIDYKLLEDDKAFHALFMDRMFDCGGHANDRLHFKVKKHNYKEEALPASYTTNPQAEVLVFSPLSKMCISQIYFEHPEDLDRYRDACPRLLKYRKWNNNNYYLVNSKKFFNPRPDYEYWKSEDTKSADRICFDRYLSLVDDNQERWILNYSMQKQWTTTEVPVCD